MIQSVYKNETDALREKFFSLGGLYPIITDTLCVFPGLCDCHVHLREPGFSYKETIYTGTRAAAKGGFTTVCPMPNLNPVPDCAENLALQTEIIKKDALIRVVPFGAITVGEKGESLSDMESMKDSVCGFSDDGRGVQSEEIMKKAMTEAKRLGKVLSAHCEVNSLLNGGYIHDGEYAASHGHRGISSESEYSQIERDVFLAGKIGVKYHVCHISTAESVDIIRKAKARGVDVTCETAPHYLTLCDEDLKEEGRFKMNPPLRSRRDREALIEGLSDGTVDIIATDHAPHSAEEKSRGLEKSSFGVVGLETSFAVMYTEFVKNKIISAEKLAEVMSINPRKRFFLNGGGDCAVFGISYPFDIDSRHFVSLGKSTPFDGKTVFGQCVQTVMNGKIIYENYQNPEDI